MTVAMLSSLATPRRFSHAFLDCLRHDNSQTAGSGSAQRVNEDAFALIVVNGEVGHFLGALWQHGQSD